MTVAASELPPPKPEPMGIFFSILIFIPFLIPASFFNKSVA